MARANKMHQQATPCSRTIYERRADYARALRDQCSMSARAQKYIMLIVDGIKRSHRRGNGEAAALKSEWCPRDGALVPRLDGGDSVTVSHIHRMYTAVQMLRGSSLDDSEATFYSGAVHAIAAARVLGEWLDHGLRDDWQQREWMYEPFH